MADMAGKQLLKKSFCVQEKLYANPTTSKVAAQAREITKVKNAASTPGTSKRGRKYCLRALVSLWRQGQAGRIATYKGDVASGLKADHQIVSRAIGASASQVADRGCRGIEL